MDLGIVSLDKELLTMSEEGLLSNKVDLFDKYDWRF